MKKIIFAVIALALLLGACTNTNTQVNTTDTEDNTMAVTAERIDDSPQAFENNMQGEYLLLDVRTPQEYDEGHIDDATLIPVSELEDRLDEIEDYKDKTVLVYCRSGNRSVTASTILLDNGFTDVHNLSNGFNGWTAYKND